MAQLNISPPKFTEADLEDAKQRQRIVSYLYKLDEQLRFVLNNLDSENFTEQYQQDIEASSDRMERTFRDGQSKVMSKLTQTAGEIRAEVTDQVEGLQSQINQTPGEISLAVSGIDVGGRNLLVDSNLTVNNGWVGGNEVSWHARNGKRIGFGGGQDANTDISANFGEIYISPGEYTISFYAWQWNLGGVYPTLYFDMHSPDRTTFAQNVIATKLEDTAAGGSIKKYIGTLNVSGYSGKVSIRFIVIDSFAQGDIGITEWKLERGNKATDWSPAPEDTDAEFEDVRAEISVTKNEIKLAVADVQVGGANILRNTGRLALANHGHDGSGSSAVGTITEDGYGGFHIVCANQNLRWWLGAYPVTPGQSYAMSIRYKMNSGSAPIQFQYIFRDAGNTDRHYWNSVDHSSTQTYTEDGWTILTSVFTAPSDASITNVNLAVRTGVDYGNYICDYNIRRPKFEMGNKATDWSPHPEEFTAGANVTITQDQFSVTAPKFNVNITSPDGTENMLNIDENGIHAKRIDCPNVAQRYDGPDSLYINPNATSAQIAAGNYFRSLSDAVAKVNNRHLDYNVSIHIASGISLYEHVTVQGVLGGGQLLIYGTSDSVLNGTISFLRCQTDISIYGLNVAIPSGINGAAYYIGTSSFVKVYDSKLSGTGRGFTVEQGSYLCAYNITFLIDGTLAAYTIWATSSFENCVGNGQLLCHRAYMTAYGTVPASGVEYWESCVPNNISSLTPTAADGSAVQPPVATTTVSYSATKADVYAGGGWSNYSNDDIYQGYTSALGEHRGCFWFDNTAIRSALSGKTIKQATLSLYQMSGSGRNQPVQVNLEGIVKNYGESGVPYGNPEYGAIGTTLGVNQATTFTLPVKVITDLVAGTINGLMLRTGETAVMKGDDNSYHYARFAGMTTSGQRPVLTVTYQS